MSRGGGGSRLGEGVGRPPRTFEGGRCFWLQFFWVGTFFFPLYFHDGNPSSERCGCNWKAACARPNTKHMNLVETRHASIIEGVVGPPRSMGGSWEHGSGSPGTALSKKSCSRSARSAAARAAVSRSCKASCLPASANIYPHSAVP